MADAVGFTVSARLGAQATDGRDAVFSTSGRTITFPGFLRVYVQGSDDPESDPDDKEKVLPKLARETLSPCSVWSRPGTRPGHRPGTPKPLWFNVSRSWVWGVPPHMPRS